MRCLRCGLCCKDTKMELSNNDIRRIVKLGYNPRGFLVIRDGIPYLRNINGYCYFHDKDSRRCRIYRYRPLGCRVYPVIYIQDVGFTIDKLCPMHYTVSIDELIRKSLILMNLIKRIEKERIIRLRYVYYNFYNKHSISEN
ncbi:MAG: YkgJ family cysteine cluster protein [Ignisphaera sp.]